MSSDGMTIEQAKRLLREIAKSRWVRVTEHCGQRMRERNVTIEDMLQALLWGEVRELERSPGRENWTCTVSGFDLEEEPLVVKVAILEADFALLCITVHG